MFGVIDWIFFAVIAIFMISALIKGFVNEFFGKASWIIGIICAIFLYAQIAVLFSDKISSPILCNILAFVIVFAASFIVLKIISTIIHKFFEVTGLTGIDKFLGAVFGFVEGFAIICLVMFLLNLQPFFNASDLLQNSFFYGLMNRFIPEIQAAVKNV